MEHDLQCYIIMVILCIAIVGHVIGTKIYQQNLNNKKKSKLSNNRKEYIIEECITEELVLNESKTEDLSGQTAELYHSEMSKYKFKLEKDIMIVHSDTVI